MSAQSKKPSAPNKKTDFRKSAYDTFCMSLVLLGIVLLFSVPIIVVIKGFSWLRTSEWETYSLAVLLDWFGVEPGFLQAFADWKGMLKIIIWLLSLDIIPIFIVLAVSLICLGFRLGD